MHAGRWCRNMQPRNASGRSTLWPKPLLLTLDVGGSQQDIPSAWAYMVNALQRSCQPAPRATAPLATLGLVAVRLLNDHPQMLFLRSKKEIGPLGHNQLSGPVGWQCYTAHNSWQQPTTAPHAPPQQAAVPACCAWIGSDPHHPPCCNMEVGTEALSFAGTAWGKGNSGTHTAPQSGRRRRHQRPNYAPAGQTDSTAVTSTLKNGGGQVYRTIQTG